MMMGGTTMTDVPEAAKTLFEDSARLKVLETFKTGDGVTYHIVGSSDEEGGDPVLLRVDGGGNAEVTPEVKPEDQTTGGALSITSRATEVLKAYRGEGQEQADDIAGGGTPLSQADLNSQFLKMAVKMAKDGFSSADAPGTDGGNLACAWAVNQCASKALGKQIGGGLATANMVVVLRNKHNPTTKPIAGAVIISASASVGGKWTIGHVGVLGKVDPADEDKTLIYSNSSSEAKFMQNFTLGRWRTKYATNKKLKVEFFELKPSLFPGASDIEVG
jgi:hypothetical protein